VDLVALAAGVNASHVERRRGDLDARDLDLATLVRGQERPAQETEVGTLLAASSSSGSWARVCLTSSCRPAAIIASNALRKAPLSPGSANVSRGTAPEVALRSLGEVDHVVVDGVMTG
jgi:hypothetical protein